MRAFWVFTSPLAWPRNRITASMFTFVLQIVLAKPMFEEHAFVFVFYTSTCECGLVITLYISCHKLDKWLENMPLLPPMLVSPPVILQYHIIHLYLKFILFAKELYKWGGNLLKLPREIIKHWGNDPRSKTLQAACIVYLLPSTSSRATASILKCSRLHIQSTW